MARLFFAIWPDATARTALAGWAVQIAKRFGGRPVPARNLHLTLVFLGEIDPGRVEALSLAAGKVSCDAFTLVLDRIGGFGRAGVAWAGCRVAPAGILGLQAELERRIRESGFQPDERAFSPHLTLARRVREPVAPGDVELAAWRVSSFALVESTRAADAYRILAEWPLVMEKT